MVTNQPQFRFLSSNGCPNAGTVCMTGALTVWGWCGECFLYKRIPLSWLHRVEEANRAGNIA